jgi:hypothetical protein
MKYLVFVVAVFLCFNSHASSLCINQCDVNAESPTAQIIASKPLVPLPQITPTPQLQNELNLSIELDNDSKPLNPQVEFQLFEKINEFDNVVPPEEVWSDCAPPSDCNDFLLVKDKSDWRDIADYVPSQNDSIDIKTATTDYIDSGRIFTGRFKLAIDPSTELSDTNQISRRFIMSMPIVTGVTEKTSLVFNVGSTLHLPAIIRPGSSSYTPTGNALVTLFAESMGTESDGEKENYTLITDTIKPGENKIFHLPSLSKANFRHHDLVRFILRIDLQVTADHGVYRNASSESSTAEFSAGYESEVADNENIIGGGAMSPLLLFLFGVVCFANRLWIIIRRYRVPNSGYKCAR